MHLPFSDEFLRAGPRFPMERGNAGHGAVGLECWMRHLLSTSTPQDDGGILVAGRRMSRGFKSSVNVDE